MNANVYIAVAAADEIEAREVTATAVHVTGEELTLVHSEEACEEGEIGTFVFSIFADVLEADELDMLHDHFDLPNLVNLPIEFI